MSRTPLIHASALLLGMLVISIWIASAPQVQADESAPDPGCDYDFDFPPGTLIVEVGFWLNDGTTDSCTGEPVCTIQFPVEDSDRCSAWPGNSGENSASNFECGEKSLSYTQWTTLTCSGGQVPDGTDKTVYTDQCNPDVPDSLRSRILDFSGCLEVQDQKSQESEP